MLSIKQTRSELVESGIEGLKDIILKITGEKVKSFHTDLSSRTGERVMVFKLCNDLEKIWKRSYNLKKINVLTVWNLL